MQLTEHHILSRGDSRFALIDRAAFAAKNLYNAANYLVRQSFITDEGYLNYYDVHAQMKAHEVYQALPRKVSQQVLRMLDKNWQAFFAAMRVYRENPASFASGLDCRAICTKLRAATRWSTPFRRSRNQRWRVG
jgi:hypothetical protein